MHCYDQPDDHDDRRTQPGFVMHQPPSAMPMQPMPPVQPDQFEQFLYKSHHASQPMPEVLMPPEVSIDAPSDSDSSRRQSYQAG